MCLSPFYPLCPPQVLVLKMQRLIHSVDFVWLLSAPGVIMLAAVPCCVQNQGPAESLKFCSCHLKEWEAVRSFGLRLWSWWPDVVSLPFPAPFLCVTLRSLIAWGAAGGRLIVSIRADGQTMVCEPEQACGLRLSHERELCSFLKGLLKKTQQLK